MIEDAILLSVKIALASVAAVIMPGIWLGWFLARRNFSGRSFVVSLTHIPLVIPPVATGYMLLITFGRNGILGSYLYDWFGLQFTFNWAGAVLASAVVSFPLMVRSVRMAVEQVDSRLEEAAASMGAGPMRTFFTITLPLSFPGIIAGAILTFARSLGEFGATITFAGNIQGETQTLPLATYQVLQMPDGQRSAALLVGISIALAIVAIYGAEVLTNKSMAVAQHFIRSIHRFRMRSNKISKPYGQSKLEDGRSDHESSCKISSQVGWQDV